MSNNHSTTTPPPSSRAVMAAVALNLGLLAIVVGTVLPLLHQPLTISRWIYSAGALLAITGRFVAPTPQGDIPFRAKRLMRLETWSTVIFAVGAFFMFYPKAGATDWIAFTLAGGFLQAYTSIMIPRALRKK